MMIFCCALERHFSVCCCCLSMVQNRHRYVCRARVKVLISDCVARSKDMRTAFPTALSQNDLIS